MHEEMPRRGPSGAVNGFQLWVNLPASKKMSAPRYQEVLAADIPVVTEAGARLRLVAGERLGQIGPVRDISAQPLYMDITLDAGAEMDLPMAPGHTALAYLFEGECEFGLEADRPGEQVSGVKMLVFHDGEVLRVRAGSNGVARFMLMAGAAFGEPIVPYGPFVMNTEDEIRQALDDLRAGTFVTA